MRRLPSEVVLEPGADPVPRIVLKRWVVGLTVAEMIVDAVTVANSARWWLTRNPGYRRLAMRSGVASTMLHAVRVGVLCWVEPAVEGP